MYVREGVARLQATQCSHRTGVGAEKRNNVIDLALSLDSEGWDIGMFDDVQISSIC